MPQLFCCAFRGPGGDDNLYYLPGWPGSDAKTMTWGPRKIQLPNRRAVSGPALAVHNNVLFMVYPDYEARLRYTTWNDNTKQWNPDAYVGSAMSNMTPSLVVFDDRLFCLHTGNEDEQLFWCTFENGTWNPDNYLAANKSGSGPSGIVYKGTLFCVHRSNADYQRRRPIYAATFHSDYNWGDSYLIGNSRYESYPTSASKIGVAILGKTESSAGVLYCVHRGENLTIEDRKIWTTTLDTHTVDGEIQLTLSNDEVSNQVYKTTDGPAVAAIRGSDGSEGLWMTARVVEDDAYLFSARWDLRSPWNTSPWVDASHLGQAQLYYDPALIAVDSTIFSPV